MTVNTIPSRATPRRSAAPGWLRSVLLLRESPLGIVGAFLVLVWVVVAIGAPWLSPYDPDDNDFDAGIVAPPSAEHWLGTDDQARDTLSRIIWGSRVVLVISPLATLCAYIVGCVMGLLAGYYRGWVDTVLMQVCNVILSFPVLVLYVIIVMKFGPSPLNIVVAVTFVASPQVARLVRSQTLELREREYVAAAKMRGEPAWYIMIVEILPDRKSTRLNSSHLGISYAVFCL